MFFTVMWCLCNLWVSDISFRLVTRQETFAVVDTDVDLLISTLKKKRKKIIHPGAIGRGRLLADGHKLERRRRFFFLSQKCRTDKGNVEVEGL